MLTLALPWLFVADAATTSCRGKVAPEGPSWDEVRGNLPGNPA